MPNRFKSAIAMYNPPVNHPRKLIAHQPHIFQIFGVKEFLGGGPCGGLDIWVLTQMENTNQAETASGGRVADGQEWQMEKSGTAWNEHHVPRKILQVVGPCVTGEQDARPGDVADSTCLTSPLIEAARRKAATDEELQKSELLREAWQTSTPFHRLRRRAGRAIRRASAALVEIPE